MASARREHIGNIGSTSNAAISGAPNAAAALGWRRDASPAECKRTSETRHSHLDTRREHGVALLIAMMAMLLMTALGAALVLTTSSEAIIAGNFRNSREGLYAAEAVLERSLDDLLAMPGWDPVLNGSLQSGFVDGAPGGSRTLSDGSAIDLGQAINLANCGKITACSTTDMDAVTMDRPWGANNPRWQLYAYGRLSEMMPTGAINSPYYVVVMVGDDPSENDDNPLQDGVGPVNPGAGVLAMRAEAFGPRGAHAVLELTVARIDAAELKGGRAGVRILSWRELRQAASAIP